VFSRRQFLRSAAAAPVLAQSAAQPPCASEPIVAYAGVDAAPNVKVLHDTDWTPPACTGWSTAASATTVAIAARFRQTSGVDALRGRVAAVSRLSGLLYWSTTSSRWQPMILNAHALAGPTGQSRADFTPDEFVPDRNFYVQQEDNVFGMATYRLRVLAMSADRLVFATENTTALRLLGLPVLAPGEVQSIVFLDRESKEVWRYYSLARTGKAAAMIPGHDASLINRAVAMFRYLAGVPADREPPAAR
jgi:hypothetical protein